ncbi:hypothetical protein SAMN02583745_02867 [Thorsellia anophelis DSM 18579]|uniref:DUF2345 domain-containing protein n=1 Tax=Thorsellia anophelis DSM 18579 TaxID=1123402 RepID=A0A1I0FRG1_9GAMM|nr:hypothetical protein SAMN02583745_02867 [Thorsellia anophelis DSM 18579]
MQAAISNLNDAVEQMKVLSDDAEKAEALPVAIDTQLKMLREDIEQLKSSVLLLSAPDGISLISGDNLQLAASKNIIANAGNKANIGVVKDFFSV